MTRRYGVLLIVGLALAGCQDPYGPSGSPQAWTERTVASPSRPTSEAEVVVRSFARLWINWDWRTVGAQQRRLARLAAPRLARQLRTNAASARLDASLARDRRGARGEVGIVKLIATSAAASGLVVTREQSYTNGRADLGGLRYRVYRVAITRHAGAWEVTRWDPQP